MGSRIMDCGFPGNLKSRNPKPETLDPVSHSWDNECPRGAQLLAKETKDTYLEKNKDY
jgi:hypothetical protein